LQLRVERRRVGGRLGAESIALEPDLDPLLLLLFGQRHEEARIGHDAPIFRFGHVPRSAMDVLARRAMVVGRGEFEQAATAFGVNDVLYGSFAIGSFAYHHSAAMVL